MAIIRFFELEMVSWFKQRNKLREMIIELFAKESTAFQSLNIIFCNDAYLLRINRDWLAHDNFTDIISFDLSDNDNVQGEIYISIPRIKENARSLGLSNSTELYRVIFHGCLHLCGYKDKLKKDQDEIRRMEDKYLHLYSLRSST
jgi:probable rRNA maturation factor